MARRILHDFCGIPIEQQSVLDPIFGLTMSKNLDGLVDVYKLGFGRVVGTVSSYISFNHHFCLNSSSDSLRDPPLLLVGDRSVEHQWFKHTHTRRLRCFMAIGFDRRRLKAVSLTRQTASSDGIIYNASSNCLEPRNTRNWSISRIRRTSCARKTTMMPIGLRQCGIGVGRWPDLKPSANRDNV